MGAVKRHLEDRTDAVLDCVRSFGVAVLVPLGVGPTAHTSALQRVRELGREWMCTDLDAEAELQRTLGALSVWTDCPPPADLLWEWRDALEDCALSVVDGLALWLEPYGLELEWTAAGLVAQRAEEETQ